MTHPMTEAAATGRRGRKEPASPSKRRGKVEVVCGFCHGNGRDPFGIMSPLATCQVCGGTGRRTLFEPIARCAFCEGTGVHPHTRMTCTSCGGVGRVEVPEGAVRCPACAGGGRAETDPDYPWADSPFACFSCGGTGMAAARGA